MTKERLITIAAVASTIIIWVAWFAFATLISSNQPTFSNRSVEPLNPALPVEALR